MKEIVGGIILKGLEIFSDERRRHLSKDYLEIQEQIINAENARGDQYNDAVLAKALEREEIFLKAYYVEFADNIKKVKLRESNA